MRHSIEGTIDQQYTNILTIKIRYTIFTNQHQIRRKKRKLIISKKTSVTILSNIRYSLVVDITGILSDNYPKFVETCTELYNKLGIAKKIIFHHGCDQFDRRYHAHGIIAYRCNEGGKRLIDRRVINRAFFKQLGNQLKGCTR